MRILSNFLAAAALAFPGVPAIAGETPVFSYASIAADADAGDPEATATLGWMYETGEGVVRDPTRAAELYRAAAAKDDAFAQWRMGVMIDEGKMAGSHEDAVLLFRKAAAQKLAGAMASLGVMHARGAGVERDYEAAMRYYQAAARMGSAHGLEGMGVLYANGQGVQRDMGEALAHWLVAASAGDADAAALLIQFMPASGTPEAAPIFARASTIADAYGVGEGEGPQSAGLQR
ncbi:tetratricopeptide repeat protein [Qipengyuania sediminis]|uniref:tetratricopeptide repeat protein n=1 Tax=Qipengyuania sediminis TaxID=1532023 RepID=UPI00105A6D18|nr:tetratricopeptide repeat protein [Qipengyuania sediminis]